MKLYNELARIVSTVLDKSIWSPRVIMDTCVVGFGFLLDLQDLVKGHPEEIRAC
jgi:hypothetical protein